ncbi:MAG: radical SAM protein [Planctomycetota bacterium]
MFRNPRLNKRIGRITESLSVALRRPAVWAPPRGIAVEITNVCNLRCPMCKLGQKRLRRDIGLMDYDSYCKLVDEVSPFVRHISFPWYGEPFARKDLGRFVRYASEKGMVIRVQTNGTYLNKCEIDYLVECNIRSVIVAIDGLEQKTYEVYRVGGNLAEVTEGVRRLAGLRKEQRSRYPEYIKMNFLVMKHNEHELPQVEDFGKKIGVDHVKIKTAHVDRTEEGAKFLPTNPKYCRYEEGFHLKSGRDRTPGCPDLWYSAVISWDGTMGLCCYDYDCEYSPGNVFEKGFFDIWFGDKMQEFRRRVLTDKENIRLCQRCHRS